MSEIIGTAKMFIGVAKNRLLDTFAHVPDDKLNWTPDPQAHSALRIMAHCAVSNHGFAAMIRGQAPSFSSVEEAVAQNADKELAITSREQAVAALETSTAELLAAVDGGTPELLAGAIQVPGRAIPTPAFLLIGGRHADGHAAQIDYLQTTWGDHMNHFGLSEAH